MVIGVDPGDHHARLRGPSRGTCAFRREARSNSSPGCSGDPIRTPNRSLSTWSVTALGGVEGSSANARNVAPRSRSRRESAATQNMRWSSRKSFPLGFSIPWPAIDPRPRSQSSMNEYSCDLWPDFDRSVIKESINSPNVPFEILSTTELSKHRAVRAGTCCDPTTPRSPDSRRTRPPRQSATMRSSSSSSTRRLSDAVADRLEVLAGDPVGLVAGPVGPVGEVEQAADLVQRKSEFTAVADEQEPVEMVLSISALAARRTDGMGIRPTCS